MASLSSPVQFGWVLPPGAKAIDINKRAANDASKPSYLGAGPQLRNARERFDAGIRRALNTITGHWDSAWVTDHFQWDDDDCLEALTELAFYAALTPQLNWGTMVLGQGYRNPALTAKMASTIQYLTDGKLIGGSGERKMLPLIARHADWWNVTAYADVYARKVEILKRECDAIGCDFSTLRLTWYGGVGIGRTKEEAERRTRDAFCRDKGFHGTTDEVAAQIERLIEAGCTYFMFDTRGIPEPGELELLIEVSKRSQG